MAKQTVVPGAEFDFATPEEIESIIAEHMGGVDRPELVLQIEANGKIDSTGLQTKDPIVIYTVAIGQMAIITRIYVTVDNAPFSFPTTSTNVGTFFGIGILRNDVVVESYSINGAANNPIFLPWSWNQGRSQGIVLRNGDALSIALGGNFNFGANMGVVARVQGWLEPTHRENGKRQ